jgi:hypothetical protein
MFRLRRKEQLNHGDWVGWNGGIGSGFGRRIAFYLDRSLAGRELHQARQFGLFATMRGRIGVGPGPF